MNSRYEKRIEALLDGALSPGQSRRLERQMEGDAEAQSHARANEALSRMVREAWTEGPASPPPERFLAAIRPELQRIDAERWARGAARSGAGPVLRELLQTWGRWLRPVPMAAGAALAATAALLLAVDLGEPLRDPAPQLAPRMVLEATPRQARELAPRGVPFSSQKTSIYDLQQGDASLLIYDGEDDSPVVIFAVPDPVASGDTSSLRMGARVAWKAAPEGEAVLPAGFAG